MQDDTGEGIPTFGPDDLEKVKELWKFRLNRAEAQTWAYRDIKFLVYDDTEDEDAKPQNASNGPVRSADSMSLYLDTLQPKAHLDHVPCPRTDQQMMKMLCYSKPFWSL